MKKNFAITAALAAMFALPTLSMGAAQIWWTLDSGDGTQVQGGVGQELRIERLQDAGVYNLTLTMWANVTAPALYSANTTLSADGAVAATAWNAVPPTGGAATPAGGLNTPGPGDIATNFGAATFSGPGYIGNMLNLGSMSLTINDVNPLAGPDVSIFARVGNGLFGTSDFATATVDYGPNLGVNGGVVGASGALPVVTIIEIVPEPATLSLLGLGALALIRRRR